MRQFSFFIVLLWMSQVRSAYMPDPPQARYDPSKVLILYDATYTGDEDMNGVQDSLQLAQFYSTARSIPQANLLPLTYAKDVDFSMAIMKSDVLAPLTQHLDSIGPTTIDIFAIMWPLPWRIEEPNFAIAFDSIIMRPYEYLSGEYVPASADCSSNAQNPLFTPSPVNALLKRFSHTGNAQTQYLVSRIDGPAGLAQKLNLIANAIYADKYINTDAFWGTTYVDTQGVPFTDFTTLGNELSVYFGDTSTTAGIDYNLGFGAYYFDSKNLPYRWENTQGLIGSDGAVWRDDNSPAKTCPRTLFYFGWYSYNVYWDVFEYLPGAYYCDFNSISMGYDIRNHYYSVTGIQSLYHGATFTMGNIDEPYGSAVARPYVPPALFLLGYTWAEAATYSLRCFAWKSTFVGDPLYQPFATKDLVVDSDAPQPSPIVIEYNNVTGILVTFSLQGIESAKMTLKYGIVSVEENKVVSRYYMTHFREPFAELRGDTTYKYQIELVDPAGNKYVSPIYTLTTRPQTPFLGTPQSVPGELFFHSFDYGGGGIASHDFVDIQYGSNGNRPDTGMQVAYYDNNFILNTYFGEWMKFTITATTTGTYSLEVMYHADSTSNIMLLLFFVDGQQAMDPFPVVPANGLGTYTMIGNLKLSAGVHVFKMMFNQTSGLQPYYLPQTAGEYYQMRFTLVTAETDTTAPTITPVSSSEDDLYFIESIQFSDEYHVARLEVFINNELSYTIYELPSDGVFPFYFDKQTTLNATVIAYDGTGLSNSWYKFFQLPGAPNTVPRVPSTAPGTSKSPESKPTIAGAPFIHRISTLLLVLTAIVTLFNTHII